MNPNVELAVARAKLAAVADLHVNGTVDPRRCAQCAQLWPCATSRIVDAADPWVWSPDTDTDSRSTRLPQTAENPSRVHPGTPAPQTVPERECVTIGWHMCQGILSYHADADHPEP